MNSSSQRRSLGFTIVELLIVIIVIAILATLVLIGYNTIQSRAYDLSVKNDMGNIVKKLEYYHVLNGTYPQDDTAEFTSRGMAISPTAYDTKGPFNIVYCYNPTTGFYLISTVSRTGNKYAVGNNFAVEPIAKAATNDGLSSSGDCSDVRSGYVRFYAGYDRDNYYNGYIPGDTYPWRQWVLSPAVIN